MCDPGSIAIAAAVVGGVTTAYGQMQAGKAARAEGNYKAAIEHNNAIRAGYLADDAIARGKIEERQQRLRGRLLVGQMRTALAGSGQVIDEGSAGELVVDQSGVNELDALNVRANAEREAYGLRAEGANFESSARLSRLGGANAARNAKFAAASTLLSTGGSVASKWYDMKKVGDKPFGIA